MSIWNPIAFIGEYILGSSPGIPLVADSNGQLAQGLSVIEVQATANATSTTSDTLLTTMTITPTPGNYMLWFSTDVVSPTAGDAISFSVYIGGTQQASTLRKIIPFSGGTLTSGNARACVSINASITVTSGQAVEIRWSSSTAGCTAAARILNLLRVS